MTCDRYRDWCLGEFPDEEFATHREDCAACREAFELDARIEEEARRIPAPASAPGLWERIATQLEDEGIAAAAEPGSRGARTTRPWRTLSPGRDWTGAWRLAAVLAVAAGLGYVLLARPFADNPRPRNLLTEDALERIETIEGQYEQALADLEALAAPVIASADTEILLRYRDRLETIDAQIRRCRDMLEGDNANAHVRRYLMAAYRDKRETLTELLALADDPAARNASRRG